MGEQVLKIVNKIYEQEQKAAKKRKKVTLEDLNLADVSKAVEVMSSDNVRLEIEKLIVDTVGSIMNGEGFKFDVPNRSSKNQMYVEELDRIVLKNNYKIRDF